MQILVTGAAGFIGADLCRKLIELDHSVVGIDNLNDYYEVSLKRDRIELIESHTKGSLFQFRQMDICDREDMVSLFESDLNICNVNLFFKIYLKDCIFAEG